MFTLKRGIMSKKKANNIMKPKSGERHFSVLEVLKLKESLYKINKSLYKLNNELIDFRNKLKL